MSCAQFLDIMHHFREHFLLRDDRERTYQDLLRSGRHQVVYLTIIVVVVRTNDSNNKIHNHSFASTISLHINTCTSRFLVPTSAPLEEEIQFGHEGLERCRCS